MTDLALEQYLARPLAPVAPAVSEAIARGPIDPSDALAVHQLDRLLDPAPLPVETGWCRMPDKTGYVAVRTEMPGVTANMIDWWFDWHPHDSLRYRVWHPLAHESNSIEPAAPPGAKPYWGTVHHPVEDIGTGTVHARIAFQTPEQIGFAPGALGRPHVGAIVGGLAGDDKRRAQHTKMVHVFLETDDGLVLRSRFWIGAELRPYAPAPVASVVGALINRPLVRGLLVPDAATPGLAKHCSEEFANLAAILPELHATYAAASS